METQNLARRTQAPSFNFDLPKNKLLLNLQRDLRRTLAAFLETQPLVPMIPPLYSECQLKYFTLKGPQFKEDERKRETRKKTGL